MRHKHKKPQQDRFGLALIIIFGVFVVASASFLVYLLLQRPASTRKATKVPAPPFYSSAAAAQPLPTTLEPSRFQEAKIQGAYAIARQKPAVLAQQPCYCGCEHQGHRSLLDCFRSEHAAACSTCVREANYAREMEGRGKCPAEIRDGIIRGDWKSWESSSR